MVEVLMLTGVVFVGLALWLGKIHSHLQKKELQELKNIRSELLEAKKEVDSLIDQLETVSAKVVDEISTTIEEAKLVENKLSQKSVQAVQTGSGGTSPDSEDAEDYEQYSKGISSRPGLNKTLTAGNDLAVSIVTANHKPVQKEPAYGNTIIFPRKSEGQMKKKEGAVDLDQLLKELPPKHQIVYAMDKLGYSEEEIAKQMKIGKGEVRLMLQLKRKGEEANV